VSVVVVAEVVVVEVTGAGVVSASVLVSGWNPWRPLVPVAPDAHPVRSFARVSRLFAVSVRTFFTSGSTESGSALTALW
jgi:hypothetical protein